MENTEWHLSELQALMDKLAKDTSLLYAPVSDFYMGRALERMPLRYFDSSHPLSAHALCTWASVKSFFARMRPLVCQAINNHNRKEMERCSAFELEGVCTDEWCRY